MSKETLLALAARCEMADGPDRAVDAEIHARIYLTQFGSIEADITNCLRVVWNDPECGEILPYTASIDAALTLVPVGHWCPTTTHCPGQKAEASLIQFELRDGKYWHGKHLVDTGRRKAATHALALCAAALKARAQSEQNHD